MSVKEQCGYLRQLVHDALSKHLYDSAVFFADKLVSLGGGSLVDIFSLAQVNPVSVERGQGLRYGS